MTDGGVSLSVDGHADRDQLASQVAARIHVGDLLKPREVADIVMQTGWLKSHDRAVRRAALLEAADELQADYDYTLSVDSGYSPSYWDGLGHAIDVVRARVEP